MTSKLLRILIGIGLILFIVSSKSLGIEPYAVNLALAVVFLVFELYSSLRFRESMKTAELTFQLRSRTWIASLIFTFYITYTFSNYAMNTWNIAAIVLFLVAGGIHATRIKHKKYVLNRSAIIELNKSRSTALSALTKVDVSEEQICIHSSEFNNLIVIPATQIAHTTFPQLKEELVTFFEAHHIPVNLSADDPTQ
ncbi:hypothetical protein BFP72_00200 [Reichenbachiella sp. 5M10]|uniref:hypothetical protein n=1 Tax=Reichenbachiella sp. 5M10 TaxID=1889772 RepID=UPI000C15DC72|nr:hypothetical protein [Reichenbachiella sp. 5M10]PIB33964.1 hypothetical protein BFP72_00200 [Reichenbachiella sp. 5M10]